MNKNIFLINRLARDSLEYYVTLQSESHRDAWTNVLILIFTKFLKLNDERVKFEENYFIEIVLFFFKILVQIFFIGNLFICI